jgi:hypothetical protein
LTLEDAIEAKQIRSASTLLEDLIRASAKYPGTDAVTRFSDSWSLKTAGASLTRWLLDLFQLKPDDLNNFVAQQRVGRESAGFSVTKARGGHHAGELVAGDAAVQDLAVQSRLEVMSF